MTASAREPGALSSIISAAPQRRFAGLVLDGVDVNAAIAAATDARELEQAAQIAQRSRERIWAERLARRRCEVEPTHASKLQLASILASAGQCDEAGTLLSEVTAQTDDTLYREVRGVLHAKAGQADQAMALFDTLPGRAENYHPAGIVLTTAQEMIEQCHAARTLALVVKLAEAYPEHLLVRSLNLQCHLLAGDFDRARELAQVPDSALERASTFERRAFVEAVVDSLELPGWTSAVFDFVRERIRKDPMHWGLYARAANAARVTSCEKEYAELLAAIPSNASDSAAARALLCRWHADENRFAEASALLDAIKPSAPVWFLEASLHLALYAAHDQERIDAAFATWAACGVPLISPAIAYGLHTYYYNCSPARLRDCLTKLEPFTPSAWNKAHFWQIYLRCLIALGEEQRAAERYSALPPGLASGAVLGPFKMFFDAAQGAHEKARKGWTRHIRATRHLCVNAQSSYPRTVRLKYSENSDAILLFTTVFNGLDYLDWFLAHYRTLGVGHFFIVDNGSTDGSMERLCAEPDISVFSNTESFGRSGFGVLWVNHLMQRFAVDHWCFHVDIDEAFVFSGCDGTRTLRDLVAYCDDRGFGCVPAIELDMYPERLDGRPADPFAASCYFDVDYVAVRSELPPYTMIQGGIRERLTGIALAMQKTPLVRMAAEVRYLECNHSTIHLPVADISGALLHHKFAGDLKHRLDEAIARKEHFAGAISYRRLQGALGTAGFSQSLLSVHSRRYYGPDSLRPDQERARMGRSPAAAPG